MGNVQGAQGARFDWLLASLIDNDGAEFVAVLVSLILQDVAQRGEPIFRVHDSGDLFSLPYIAAWHRIAETLPDVQFWIPTRSHVLPNLLPALVRLNALPNVVVRPSALELDAPAPVVAGLSAGTAVIRSLPVIDTLPADHVVCPKTDPRDGRNNCGDCRNCWEGSQAVAYLEH